MAHQLSDKNTQIRKAFNEHLVEFFEDLANAMPSQLDIKKGVEATKLLKKTKPKHIIENWKYYYELHKERIDNEGIQFYMTYDCKQDIYKPEFSYIEEMIERIKQSFHILSESDKKKTYEYIKNLNKLVDMYVM
jgi:hypothetical protein